jgi:hypothetical protein
MRLPLPLSYFFVSPLALLNTLKSNLGTNNRDFELLGTMATRAIAGQNLPGFDADDNGTCARCNLKRHKGQCQVPGTQFVLLVFGCAIH